MRHIFLTVVIAVAIMGCAGSEGIGDCEEQEVEIDCLEAMAEAHDALSLSLQRLVDGEDVNIHAALVDYCINVEWANAYDCDGEAEMPAACD